MLPMTDALTRPAATPTRRRQTADTIFRGALAFNAALTVFWLVTFLSGGSYFFQDYRVDWQTVGRILSGVLFFYVVWGIIWWAVKAALLRFFVGFTKEERRDAFSSRMDRPYDVADLVSRYSERRIRIADMIGRRGRFMTLAAAGFYYLYVQVARDYDADFASAFFQDNLLDGVITSWIFLGFYHVSGLLGAFFYGPQSRVMDGVLARANCLLITTLWTLFKFVMVPIGAQLAVVFPKRGVRAGLRAHLGLLPLDRRLRGDLRIAVRPAAHPRARASATSTASRSPASSRASWRRSSSVSGS